MNPVGLRGLLNVKGKLSDDEVVQIKLMHQSGALLREIAKQFDVSKSHICRIVHGGRRAITRT